MTHWPVPAPVNADFTETDRHMVRNVADQASGTANCRTLEPLLRRSLGCLHLVKIVSKFRRLPGGVP